MPLKYNYLMFIKQVLQKCLEEQKKDSKMKKHHFIQQALKGVSKCSIDWITKNYREAYEFMLVMEFYLITESYKK